MDGAHIRALAPVPRTKPTLPRPHCLRPPENFAAGVWASLQSGYARLARRPDTGILQTNPVELPLIESETVFRQTQPPLQRPLSGAMFRPRSVSLGGDSGWCENFDF